MSSLPAPRHPATCHSAPRRPGTSAASRLWSESAWVLPSMFTVSAFSVLVSLSLVFATVQPAIAEALRGVRGRGTGAGPHDDYELRSPERAVAESAEGLLRHIDF